MTDAPSIQILVTPDFQGQLRKLAKRYRNIRSDLQPLFDDLESGNCPGDQISWYNLYRFQSPRQK
jgi:mRNA-degrading endonuclease RelE of RelBE toxin-antitoxin system